MENKTLETYDDAIDYLTDKIRLEEESFERSMMLLRGQLKTLKENRLNVKVKQ